MSESAQQTEVVSLIPQHILENLKSHVQHRDGVTCLECGYKGMMGIKAKGSKPFSSAFWALVIVFWAGWFGAVGIIISPAIFGAAWVFILQASAKPILSCPNCKADIRLK